MIVEGDFSVTSCEFSYRQGVAKETEGFKEDESRVSFNGAPFSDFFLNDCSFDMISTVDFTRIQANLISVDRVTSKTPAKLNLRRMVFKLVSPVNPDDLWLMQSDYNAEFYTDLENSLRTHGYPDQADKIFIAKKRSERRNYGALAWAWSGFQDLLIGYGKNLERLLYWSAIFLLLGMIVFRGEHGMRIRYKKDAPNAGKYRAFWYSLDLFLPIIKLGEANIWTPKEDRRWANIYRKVHIIIGSLFVPIGLAAWTGIIK